MKNILTCKVANTFRTLFLLFFLFPLADNAFTQLGFFEEYWQPKTIVSPEGINKALPVRIPEIIVNVDIADTINKVSPYVGGNNLTTFFGGKFFDKPDLIQHIRNVNLPILRFPGGTGSNSYFWDLNKPQWPPDFGGYLLHGTKQYTIKWGDEPGTDYLSLDNYYILRDTLQNAGINVVNYYYARYGLSENPVQQAAHYAANWVRYDNGRTKFWEIGNEVYGNWNPGFYIETNLNKDGQPYQINGALYAQHCLVFLDSMRAAAAEIGADIKIGAALGFQQNRTAWDIPLLQILGNKVDFYIIHRYYGQNTNGDYDQVLRSFDLFYEDKRHIDSLINKYCETYVPLVKTEWNTNFTGRKQGVSCATGMHALLGYKGIINEGIGIELRWNLVWSYKDGDSHGLISNERDNPLIEGIPRFFPRAPFHYLHHFNKFLGDVSIRNDASISDSIDVFSSSFGSGHVGLSIVNRTLETKIIAVNLDNYDYGENFYWYTLTPEGNKPFSPKVLVNGQTNPDYAAGGPINYADIEPWKASIQNGIRLELPPFSATFVLVEGEKKNTGDKQNFQFNVFGQKEGEIFPLDSSMVQIGKSLYLPDENGILNIALEEGNYEYSLFANGFESKSGTFSIPENTFVSDTLDFVRYNLQIKLVDQVSLTPLENINVSVKSLTKVSSSEGIAEFPQTDFGFNEVKIKSNLYKKNMVVEIFSDTLITVSLTPADYSVSFRVIDHVSQVPLSTAKVEFNNVVKYTSLNGLVTYSEKFGVYDVKVQLEGYSSFQQSIELADDTLIIIPLNALKGDIRFRLSFGDTPMNNAEVKLNNETRMTNALGICTFPGLETNIHYPYTVIKPPYADIRDTLLLLTDTTVNINYKDITYQVTLQSIDRRKGFPVPYSQMLLNGVFRMADAEGKANYIIPTDNYGFSVSANRYMQSGGDVTPVRDTLIEVPLELTDANIRFNVRNKDEPVRDAFVTMNSKVQKTNILGVAVFDNVPLDEFYNFSIVKEGYNEVLSGFFAYHDSTLIVELNISSGMSNPAASIGVYPVPAVESVTVTSEYFIQRIAVRDIYGKVLISKDHIDDYSLELNTASLPPGIFFIKVYTACQRTLTARLIIGT